MADFVPISAGSGVTVSTDQVSSGAHYQRVKITDGTANSENHLLVNGDGFLNSLVTVNNTVTVDATGSGDVPVTLDSEAVILGASEAFIGLATISIGDSNSVDVTSVIPGTGAADLGKEEDTAHAAGDTGVMALGVRNDSFTSLTGTNLDYSGMAVDEYGRSMTLTYISESPYTGALIGDGDPSIDSYTQFAINLGAAADQVLVSSAANKQIWVYAVTYTCSVAGTVSFQDEDDTAITGIMDHAANSGLAIGASGNFAMPLWKLGTDKDLEVDVVDAAIDGFITYAIVSV